MPSGFNNETKIDQKTGTILCSIWHNIKLFKKLEKLEVKKASKPAKFLIENFNEIK